ncbi:MAG: CoA-binding protein [Myxococcaceae bacterium]|nr:CoA-binding protein [Myxococcaceae bacterium]MCA3013414.1 CoA-binding protein [Myxococcaceae bacterium]
MARLIDDEPSLAVLVQQVRRVAVLGIKTEQQAGQPAFDVPAYLAAAGLEVLPVPVYFPEVTRILGQPVVRRVVDVPGGPVDLVDVFRRPSDLPPHLDDLLAARPKAVWLQLGIRNDGFAQRLVEAGIDVVQDRCLMVDHRRYARRQA